MATAPVATPYVPAIPLGPLAAGAARLHRLSQMVTALRHHVRFSALASPDMAALLDRDLDLLEHELARMADEAMIRPVLPG